MPPVTTTLPDLKPRYVVDEKGKQVEVILDVRAFRKLVQELEDYYDNLLVAETDGEEEIPMEVVFAEEDKRRRL